ncbi:MAG TPA: hypothetical protein VL326_29780 [Kofleriaceae bacterium]|nr:hypothetical protein [Kofleriaceae bacterium]
MGSVVRFALVGSSIIALASGHAFAEAQPQRAAPPQAQAAPPQAPPPQQAPPQQPAPQPPAPPLKKAAPKQAKKAPAPKAPPSPKTDKTKDQGGNDFTGGQATQVPTVGDGAPSSPRCQITPVTGTPIFEARYASGKKSIVTKLYASGTFTRVVLKQSPLRTSCVEADRLGAIRTALAEAPWQTTKRPVSCTAASAETTAIFAAGKLRFTSRECNPLVLDAQSSKALDLIGAYVGPFGLEMADVTGADIGAN